MRLKHKGSFLFCSWELCAGWWQPLTKFVWQMLLGIQSSQDVKLSNIARSLRENIELIRTEKRLSRNLKSAELEKEVSPQLARMGSSRVQPNTVLALDRSDIRKEYAQKMERLAMVRDGSTGELHQGYWLWDVTAAEVNGSQIVPLYQNLFSVEAKEFSSENAEIPAAVDWIGRRTQGRGIWAMDRGGDRKKLLERGHQARIVKIQDGQEKTYELRYGADPIRLPGRSEQLWLVVVAGFGEESLMLLTDLPLRAGDSQSLWSA